MRPITPKSAATLLKLIEGLDENNRSRKVAKSSTFMPVTVEFLTTTLEGDLFSVCHYYEQSGDLMRDPEVVFLRQELKSPQNDPPVTHFFPISFQQDNLGIYQELVRISDKGKISGLAVAEQNQCAKFCNTWMQNIKLQQCL